MNLVGGLIVALVAACGAQAQGAARLVRTAQGPVRGHRAPEGGLYAFYNIPYASAPTGTDRFKAPLPPPVWMHPFEAVDQGVICPQVDVVFGDLDFKRNKKVQENCLITNIYVPDTEETNLSVVVYVHGGGYQAGYGDMITVKDHVRTNKIIAVNFNYRLGVHGFLCLGTTDVPGNAGMKDQVALLRWVKNNIAYFGGNPNDVTICGASAGSSAVDLLQLSKSTIGLFNKVIPESGANVAVWSVQLDPIENAKKMAESLNFTEPDNFYALEEFYKTASFELLTNNQLSFKPDGTIGLTPCVERDVGEEIFLDDAPVNILKEGKYVKYPMLYGFTNMEGLIQVPLQTDWFEKMNMKFFDFIPADLQFESDKEKEEVAKVIKEFYFGDKAVGEETILNYIEYFTDVMFAYPHLRSVKLQVSAGNDKIYLYEYSFPDAQSTQTPEYLKNLRGANHCMQTMAVADSGGLMAQYETNSLPENYKKMKSVMRELWQNFILTGTPVPPGCTLPEWLPTGASGAPHMSLNETLELRGALIQRRFLFWDDIYERHYRSPKPPTPPPPTRIQTCGAQAQGAARLVRTAQGPVRGHRAPEGGLYAFYNIPYASAPTGTDRFKAPHPPPMWLETFEAVDQGVICPQAAMPPMDLKINKNVTEDCLIANIYVPDTEDKNLPVVVYVHGGGYQLGFGDMVTLKKIVREKKVIAINFNYRVGVHGFLCLGTKDAPGNAGLKDQVALLRWVKKNIASFGGNPDDVTVAGYSAGSSAVDLLMLSKTTKGLFKKVIPESGANVGVWSVQLDPLENARAYAKQVNFTDVDDVYALEKFYTTAPLELLTTDVFMDGKDSNFIFVPCIERDTGVERILDDSPVNILKTGKYNKLPLLYGFANMEGLFRVPFFGIWAEQMNKKFSDFLPADLQFDSDEQKEETAKIVKEFYFGDKQVNEENIVSYIDYYTDILFAYPHLRSVKLQVEAGNNQVYLYEYSFYDELPGMEAPELLSKVNGANHVAQTVAVHDGHFLVTEDETQLSERYQKMKSTMRELWHNFITTGTPVPEGSGLPSWPPAGAERAPHMALDAALELRGPLLQRRARFWDRLYERHYRQPQPPPTPPPRPRSEL